MNYSKYSNTKPYPGYRHQKADVSRGFRKCGTFWVYDFLKGSYWLSKSSQISKKNWVRGSVPKKSHGHNFNFSGLARNQRLTNRVDFTLIPWRARKIKIVAVSFFLFRLLFLGTDPKFQSLLTLSSNNSH